MSRYATGERATFTNAEGESYEIILPQNPLTSIPYSFEKKVDILSGEELDRVAVRPEVYGDEAWTLWFFLFDFNIVRLSENDFCTTNFKSLDVPIQQSS